MLRPLFRSSRTAFTSTRAFAGLRTASQAQSGASIYVQNVKVRQRYFRPRNIAIALGVSLICWEIYFDVVIAPFVEWSRKELDKLSPEELQKLDEESDRFFVPLPFTTRKIEQRPYRGTDPEWQEFIKLSKDIALQKNIRTRMGEIILEVAGRNPTLVKKCGKDMKIRRMWLDIDYPYIPPPVFERSVIEVTDKGFEIVDKPIDANLALKTSRIMAPFPTLSATWAFTEALVKQAVTDLRTWLGMEDQSALSTQPPRASDSIDQASRSTLALQKFREKWRPVRAQPPRGCVQVSGLVEVETSKAFMVFDVSGWWDPKAHGYHYRSMVVYLKRFQRRAQAPIR